MTINDALLSVYPNQIVGEPVRLGTKLYLTVSTNDYTSYWITREGTNNPIFKFTPSGMVYVYNDVTLTPHEKRVINKIISMWRDNMRPDWRTFESMRARSTEYGTLVPVTHNTL